MIIIQQPGAYCLTSTVKDFIISSVTNINFRVLIGTDVLLSETYAPDSTGKIYIKNLGRFFESYLLGQMKIGVQGLNAKTFLFKVDDVAAGSTVAILCRAFTGLDGSNFCLTQLPLNLQYLTKITIPSATEFLTYYLKVTDKVKVKILYKSAANIIESALVDYFVPTVENYQTLEISLHKIALLFPAIDASTIVSYLIGFNDLFIHFKIEWDSYLDTKRFIYLNSFSVPETLITRGEVYRKGVLSADSSMINNVEKRYNIKRADTFDVSSGKKFSTMDNTLLREMMQSELIKVYYCGEYREVYLIEENSTENLRRNSFSASGFTFRFADNRLNLMMRDPLWSLAAGTWNDAGDWLDDGQWNDNANVTPIF